MNFDWPIKTIGEFCPFKYGKNLPERDRKVGQFGVYSSAGLVGSHDSPYVNSPGVVVGRKGTVGSVTFSACPFWPIDTAFFIEDEPDVRDIRFTYYLLKTLGLHLMNTDSAVPGLNRDNAHAIEIRIPPLSTQKTIADFLQHLDDRITLLRETNATLEAIAQALFKSWFVDFDPVRAKMEGRVPEGMDEATAALFPDSFEETELGVVPRGWRAGTLADLSVLNPESWTAKNHPETIAYLDLANVKDNQIGLATELMFNDAPSRARRILRDGDSILGTVRPGNRSFAFICNPNSNLTASTGFAVLRPLVSAHKEFVFLAATQDSSIDYLAHTADGGAYPAVRPEAILGLSCVVPDNEIINRFHIVTETLLLKVSENQKRAQTLALLRDTLLPRLISGQLLLTDSSSGTAQEFAHV